MSLISLGWNEYFNTCFGNLAVNDDELKPARVICGYKQHYKVGFDTFESLATVSGKFRYQAEGTNGYPVVGDWVAAKHDTNSENAIIHHLLPRTSSFSRKAAGSGVDEQMISANIDTCFIVTAFDRDFNERRIERYLTLVFESGITPVIIINKSDLCDHAAPYLQRMEMVALGTPVLTLSTQSVSGFDLLYTYLAPGRTACFIGSSGVGKSSIINILAGETLLKTGEVRKDGKGRHTTSLRELFDCGEKGIVIDNPGMREVQLWATEDAVDGAFTDIDELSHACRYHDCSHSHEPGCAVVQAVETGDLDRARYESYLRQKNELNRLSRYRGLSKKEIQQKRRDAGKRLSKFIRKMKKDK